MSVPHLNLINFEHPVSKNSKYILTSPKSLKACQKAGIKPVELLYRSLDDVKQEVGARQAQKAYQELEKERQEKLETCRRIRNELLMQGYPYVRSSSSLRNHHGNQNSPCPTPVARRRPSLERSEVGSQSDFKSQKQESAPYSKSSSPISRNQGLLTLDKLNTNVKIMDNKDSMKSPLAVESEVFPIGNNNTDERRKLSKQPSVTDDSSLPLVINPEPNNRSWEERKVKSADQASSTTNSPPKRKGKHKRSHSLPFKAEIPRGLNSDFKVKNAFGCSSVDQGQKSSPGILDLEKIRSGGNSENPGRSETPLIQRKHETHMSLGDVNNNRCKTPIIMRPLSSRKKKHLERRKLIECKKVFDHILAQYKDPEYCLLKYKQIIDNSIERELREQEVKKVQRRMEEGFEMWQDKVLMLQWLDCERAEEQVTKSLTSKIEKLRRQQKNKEIVHALNLNKVKEEEDIRAEILRRELEKKERKIQILQEEKERVIMESKSRALAVSELKEQIRNIMTPETFDHKVSKCGREKKVIRVLHPPNRCPAIMQQSHISLG